MTYSKVIKVSLFSMLFSICFAFGTVAQQLSSGEPSSRLMKIFSDEEYDQFVTINQSLAPHAGRSRSPKWSVSLKKREWKYPDFRP